MKSCAINLRLRFFHSSPVWCVAWSVFFCHGLPHIFIPKKSENTGSGHGLPWSGGYLRNTVCQFFHFPSTTTMTTTTTTRRYLPPKRIYVSNTVSPFTDWGSCGCQIPIFLWMPVFDFDSSLKIKGSQCYRSERNWIMQGHKKCRFWSHEFDRWDNQTLVFRKKMFKQLFLFCWTSFAPTIFLKCISS